VRGGIGALLSLVLFFRGAKSAASCKGKTPATPRLLAEPQRSGRTLGDLREMVFRPRGTSAQM